MPPLTARFYPIDVRCTVPRWRNGRRTSFRCWRSQGRGGSSPLLGTICTFVVDRQSLKKSRKFAIKLERVTVVVRRSSQAAAANGGHFGGHVTRLLKSGPHHGVDRYCNSSCQAWRKANQTVRRKRSFSPVAAFRRKALECGSTFNAGPPVIMG